jgi:hypothetical protein
MAASGLAIALAIVLGLLGWNLGWWLNITCEKPKTKLEKLCYENAGLIKWLSAVGATLYVISISWRR